MHANHSVLIVLRARQAEAKALESCVRKVRKRPIFFFIWLSFALNLLVFQPFAGVGFARINPWLKVPNFLSIQPEHMLRIMENSGWYLGFRVYT